MSTWISVLGLIFVFMAMITSTTVQAETAEIGDTELRAAYCLGVSTQHFEQTSIELKKAEAAYKAAGDFRYPSPAVFVNQEILKHVTDRRDRLRDYLATKGFLSGRNVRLIDVPLQRGVKDVKQCDSDNDDPITKVCRQQQKCGSLKSIDEKQRCDQKCLSSVACDRVKSCLENFLPF